MLVCLPTGPIHDAGHSVSVSQHLSWGNYKCQACAALSYFIYPYMFISDLGHWTYSFFVCSFFSINFTCLILLSTKLLFLNTTKYGIGVHAASRLQLSQFYYNASWTRYDYRRTTRHGLSFPSPPTSPTSAKRFPHGFRMVPFFLIFPIFAVLRTSPCRSWRLACIPPNLWTSQLNLFQPAENWWGCRSSCCPAASPAVDI